MLEVTGGEGEDGMQKERAVLRQGEGVFIQDVGMIWWAKCGTCCRVEVLQRCDQAPTTIHSIT